MAAGNKFCGKIVGEKTESILNRTDANLFMCRFDKPFISHKSIICFVPSLAESELGFGYWMEKMLKLAQELSIPMKFVCNSRTQLEVEKYLEEESVSVPVSYENYEDWDNIYGLSAYAEENALLAFVSSRSGEVSYRDSLDGLAKRIGRYYKERNLILIFPSRLPNEHIDAYEDVKAAPIFRKLSREIGNMFSKDKI